jgi:hypothetical protein
MATLVKIVEKAPLLSFTVTIYICDYGMPRGASCIQMHSSLLTACLICTKMQADKTCVHIVCGPDAASTDELDMMLQAADRMPARSMPSQLVS